MSSAVKNFSQLKNFELSICSAGLSSMSLMCLLLNNPDFNTSHSNDSGNETDENGEYVLDADGNPIVKDASGYKAIIQKFNILKEYFANTWGMDITKLREVILRRTAEVKAMDLETLK